MYVALVVLLVAVIALLWYGVRTHKTRAELEAKVKAQADELAQKVKDALDKVKT